MVFWNIKACFDFSSININKMKYFILFIILISISGLSFSQTMKYPYVSDTSAVNINKENLVTLCTYKWKLIKLEETLRGEKRQLSLSTTLQYLNDSLFQQSSAIGKFKVENEFFINHYDLSPSTEGNKAFINGIYFISRINSDELILVKYSTSSKDWKKEYFFKSMKD